MQRKKYKNLKKRYGIFVDAPVGTPIEIYLDDVNGKKVRETPTNNVVTIPFGMQGKAPMMVAVEPTRAWMAERKAVPNNWFSIVPDRLKNRPDEAEVEEQETPETELPVATDEE